MNKWTAITAIAVAGFAAAAYIATVKPETAIIIAGITGFTALMIAVNSD